MWELKQFIKKEYCLGCQGCCRFAQQESIWQPHLMEEEIVRIAPFSKKVEAVKDAAGGDFHCQFLNRQDNKCKIYSIRPFECRLYPFLLNRRGKKVYLSVDLKCPYVREGAALEAYKDYVSSLTALFGRPALLEEVKKNPQLIQPYEDVLDIVELKL